MTADSILALVEEYGQTVGRGDGRHAELLAQIDAAVTGLANHPVDVTEYDAGKPPTDPAVVVHALERQGWVKVGYRTGSHIRLCIPNGDDRSTLIPLDPDAPEYPSLMTAALADLQRAADTGSRARRALNEIFEEAP